MYETRPKGTIVQKPTKFNKLFQDTYSCLSNNSLSEFIEVDEKLLDSDSVFGASCLKILLDVKLNIHESCGVLLGGRMERIDHRDSYAKFGSDKPHYLLCTEF